VQGTHVEVAWSKSTGAVQARKISPGKTAALCIGVTAAVALVAGGVAVALSQFHMTGFSTLAS
jgi:hypothetical protein